MSKEHGSLIVAVDSMALVWGIRKEGTATERSRARWLFEQLDNEGAQVLIPSVVLAEYLTLVDPKKHRDVIAELSTRFIIPPFDVQCASLAAEPFVEGKQSRQMDEPGARKCLRADCLIVATAAVHGARILYSGDGKCRNLAAAAPNLQAQDLPTIPPSLFSYSEPED